MMANITRKWFYVCMLIERARNFVNFHLCLELITLIELSLLVFSPLFTFTKEKPLHECAVAAFLLVYYAIYWICQKKSQTSLGAGRDCV